MLFRAVYVYGEDLTGGFLISIYQTSRDIIFMAAAWWIPTTTTNTESIVMSSKSSPVKDFGIDLLKPKRGSGKLHGQSGIP